MKKALKELLIADLSHILQKSEHVIADESIRLIVEKLKTENKLVNPLIKKVTQICNFFKAIHHEKKECHYQVILESGERGQLNQGDWGSIHYAAMDVFCNENGEIIVLIADHYHGAKYNSFRAEYNQLGIPIFFIVVGGSLYQADRYNCIFFTLRHLELSADDETLKRYLLYLVNSNPVLQQNITWFDLNPKYNLATQSFSRLTDYVSLTKHNQDPLNQSPEKSADILIENQFDRILSKTLECGADQKIRNYAIQGYAIKLINECIDWLNNPNEQDLVHICYADKTLAQAILSQALSIAEAGSAHPLYSFMFSNPAVLNFFSQISTENHKIMTLHSNFFNIFNQPKILSFMRDGLVDPYELLSKLVKNDGKKLTFSAVGISSISLNLPILNYITISESGTYDVTIARNILQSLLLKNAVKVLEKEPFRRLFLSGKIDVNLIPAIRYNLFEKEALDDLTDEELSMKIKEFAGVPSPVSVIETPHMHTKKSIFSGHKKAKTNVSSNENLIRDESFNETYKK